MTEHGRWAVQVSGGEDQADIFGLEFLQPLVEFRAVALINGQGLDQPLAVQPLCPGGEATLQLWSLFEPPDIDRHFFVGVSFAAVAEEKIVTVHFGSQGAVPVTALVLQQGQPLWITGQGSDIVRGPKGWRYL